MRSRRARVTSSISSGSSNHITPSITMRFSGLSMFSQRESFGDRATRSGMAPSCPFARAESHRDRAVRDADHSAGASASSSSISALNAATRLAMSGTTVTSVLNPTRIWSS